MSPMMWHENFSDYMPLHEVYTYVVNQLDPKRYSKEQREDAEKIRQEVLGNDWMRLAPDIYWDVAMLIDLGIKPSEWRNPKMWTQLDRAKVRAYRFIETMKYVCERYNDYQKEKRDKLKKAKSDPKGK